MGKSETFAGCICDIASMTWSRDMSQKASHVHTTLLYTRVGFQTQMFPYPTYPTKIKLWNSSKGSRQLYFNVKSWISFLSINLEQWELISHYYPPLEPQASNVSGRAICFRKNLGPLGPTVLDRVRPHIGYMGVCMALGYSLSLIMRHFGIFQQGPQLRIHQKLQFNIGRVWKQKGQFQDISGYSWPYCN